MPCRSAEGWTNTYARGIALSAEAIVYRTNQRGPIGCKFLSYILYYDKVNETRNSQAVYPLVLVGSIQRGRLHPDPIQPPTCSYAHAKYPLSNTLVPPPSFQTLATTNPHPFSPLIPQNPPPIPTNPPLAPTNNFNLSRMHPSHPRHNQRHEHHVEPVHPDLVLHQPARRTLHELGDAEG